MHTATSLRYLACCFFLSLCAFAQWHEDAWTITGNSLARTRYALQTNLWCAPQSFVLTNAVYAYNTNIVSGGMTNSIPYYTNTVSTQSFLVAIGPDTNSIDTNTPPLFSWPLNYATNQLTTNVALVPFTFVATGKCDRVSSNLWLDAAGVRDLDVYFALQERHDAAGFEDPDPPRFYRSHYDNVTAAKSALAGLVPYYLDNFLASNGAYNVYFANSNTNGDFWTNGVAREFPQYHDATNLAMYIRAPTNYFELTLVRSVDSTRGYSVSMYYLLVCTNSITSTGTNAAQILTQDVFKTWGEPWRMIGTNGQRFTSTSTNHEMERLFESADYGQWRLRAAITNLQATQSGFDATGDYRDDVYARFYQYNDGYATGFSTNWAAAKSSAELYFTSGAYGPYFDTNSSAGIIVNSFGQGLAGEGADASLASSRLLLAVTNSNTNISFRADWYIWPSLYMLDLAKTTNFVYDANGTLTGDKVPQLLTAQTAQGSNGYAEASAWFGPADVTTTLPTWCDEPPHDGTIYERGFYATFRAVLWWDFKYR